MFRKKLMVKTGLNKEEFFMLHPSLMILIGAFHLYAQMHNQDSIITSLIRKDGIHADGRAVDFRSITWPKLHINRVCWQLNQKYKDIAAIGSKSGKPIACYYHKVGGGEYHFHLQVKP